MNIPCFVGSSPQHCCALLQHNNTHRYLHARAHHHHHHHHHVTQSSHSINAIGPAPLWSGRKREHCSIMQEPINNANCTSHSLYPINQQMNSHDLAAATDCNRQNLDV
jgi:hypothetical protein